MVAWNEMPDRSRSRLWCKHCRELGLPWILGENCQHVMTARATRQMTQEEVEKFLQEQKHTR